MMVLKKGLFKMAVQVGHDQNNMRRFYKEAMFSRNPQQRHPLHNYLITLDGRTIKSPYRNVLAVPSSTLAFLVANQFNRQIKYMKTGQMPLLALCRTAVDADIQGHLAEHLRHSIYEYLKTDTLLFVDHSFESQHNRLSNPLIQNFCKKFSVSLQPSRSIDAPKVQINPAFTLWLESLNNWQLIGMETMTIWMKSTIAAYSIIGSQVNPGDIQKAAYLQQITQMHYNGQVQQKIMDINQIRLMVSCGQILFRFGHSDVQ